jgi:hypothetical protein
MGEARAPHPAEYNLIQRPDLLRRLTQRLGIRQMHVAPALSEGVQTVVVLEDLTRQADALIPFAIGMGTIVFGAGQPAVHLFNIPGSGIRVKVEQAIVTVGLAAVASGFRLYRTLAIQGGEGVITTKAFQDLSRADEPQASILTSNTSVVGVELLGEIGVGAAQPPGIFQFTPSGLYLGAGNGLLIAGVGFGAGDRLTAMFQWREEAST